MNQCKIYQKTFRKKENGDCDVFQTQLESY